MKLDLATDRKLFVVLIAHALLANFDAQSPATVVQWTQGDRLLLGIRSQWLQFARRLGSDVDAMRGARVVEAELASVLNLGWLEGAETDPTGEYLLLNLSIKGN